MKTLEIIRTLSSGKSTIGQWLFEHKALNLVSLEDRDRGFSNLDGLAKIRSIKVDDQTAIGVGEYPLTITHSKRFKQPMLHILDTVGFGGVRIHVLNKPEESEGCIGIGTEYNPKKPDFISGSREGYKKLLSILAPIMGFTIKTDKKNNTLILLPEKWKQKEEVKLIVKRNYA